MTVHTQKITSASGIEDFLSNLPADRAGLPARDSVTAITQTPKFSILHSEEVDRYEEGAGGLGLAPTALAAVPTTDNFAGTDRKAAKLSLAAAPMETFADIADLIASLKPETQMTHHVPKIKNTSTSNRVTEEERNIHVDAFIYAASRESDNDFHLIVGRDPQADSEMYITMELSGLPPTTAPAFALLNAARNSFKQFFADEAGGHLPGTTYDFYDPPLAVTVEGSLFFDITHASGSRPGPASLKGHMPVIWEVHPISSILFKPAGHPGLPAPEHITGVDEVTTSTRTLRIIHTTERDEYDS